MTAKAPLQLNAKVAATNPGLEAVFVVNLVQDVNILRPLAVMARRDFAFEVRFLAASKFVGRDISGAWQNELSEIASEAGADIRFFENECEALAALNGHGLLVAASESNLPGHAVPHDLLRIAPPSYLRVTLQHGFECVGFRHSAAHTRAHGADASFAADVVCAWFGESELSALARSQRAKVIVTGPTAVLQQHRGPIEGLSDAPGLVCENLHSVRMNATGDLKAEFVDVFAAFCAGLEKQSTGSQVCLRPHPGGQYTVRNNLPLPPNARLENAPIYRVDLRRFAYGISAPSSVLLDMVLAGIPTAVWRDGEGRMDTDNYVGLPSVSTVEDWISFSRLARAEPDSFAEGRQRFLERFGLLTKPDEVYSRYAELFALVRRNAPVLIAAAQNGGLRFNPPVAQIA